MMGKLWEWGHSHPLRTKMCKFWLIFLGLLIVLTPAFLVYIHLTAPRFKGKEAASASTLIHNKMAHYECAIIDVYCLL